MIVYKLGCSGSHVFEAWFRDSAGYEAQAAAGEISCPVCGDTDIAKAPMAPNIAVGGGGKREAPPKRTPARRPGPPAPPEGAQAVATLRRMRSFIERNFDHVGGRFPKEARKIHYGEVERRNIYGDATREEVVSLEDEGIEIGEIPWVPRHDA